jgi:hypothetical protein
VDTEAARGTSGVTSAVWGATKVMGTVRGTVEVGEADNDRATWGRVVRSPEVVVGWPASVPSVVRLPGQVVIPPASSVGGLTAKARGRTTSLYRARLDHPGARSNHQWQSLVGAPVEREVPAVV